MRVFCSQVNSIKYTHNVQQPPFVLITTLIGYNVCPTRYRYNVHVLNSRSVGSCNRCAYNKAKLNRTVYDYFKTVNNQYVTNAKH